MRLVSWNVNGLRACLKTTGKDLKSFLDSLEADVICLQETKATKDQLDSSMFAPDGYNAYFSFCRKKGGYSGVVTFCRNSVTPLAAEEGLTGVLSSTRQDSVGCYGDDKDFTVEDFTSLDAEGRSILTEHRCVSEEGEIRVVVVNVYCPMVDSDNQERLGYKLKFYATLQDRCTAIERAGKLVIAVGDFNCSREAIDSAYVQDDATLLTGSPAREWMKQFAISDPSSSAPDSTQMVDTFRYLHPSQKNAYTCWSTILDCRKTNHGTRIDLILVSQGLVKHLSQAAVWQHVQGSDHCPVFAEFCSLQCMPSVKPPSLSSYYFSELKQSKLSAFLSRAAESGALKRSLTDASSTLQPKSKKIMKSEQTLFTLFNKTAPTTHNKSNQVNSSSSQPEDDDGSLSESSQPLASSQLSESSQPQASSQLSEEWRNLFSGPPKPPLCKGHNEPSVLRTVRKAGPNRNRQFWTCARPGGSTNDPRAKCNFFQWATRFRNASKSKQKM